MFGKRESWFKQRIFTPYLKGVRSLPYTSDLYYFGFSLLWRLSISIGTAEPELRPYKEELEAANEEWRCYLSGGLPPSTYNDLHLFLTDIGTTCGTQPVKNWSRYMARNPDAVIAHGLRGSFVYGKFARFAFFAGIRPSTMQGLVGTRVEPLAGTLNVPQSIQDGYIGSFLLDRARLTNQRFERGLSEQQREVIWSNILKKREKFLESDLGRASLADHTAIVDPHPLLSKRVGRNDLCPCGSGRKYKKCCSLKAEMSL